MGSNPDAGRPRPPAPACLGALIAALSSGLVGRAEQARCLVLATLCGEHVLLVGPPGTAKSELARRLRDALGGRWFERLLTRFTVPEELFGPLSLAALDEGRYQREIDGYLPTASVAFLDEVFKANSAILNALLTLLNERVFDQGADRIPVPLAMLVAATNEVPGDEALRAFHDRFLFRCGVTPVGDEAFEALLRTGEGGPGAPRVPPLAAAALDALRAEAARGVLPGEVVAALTELRGLLSEAGADVSDRRWVRSVRVLRIAAASHGRREIGIVDLWPLRWLLATDAVQVQRIEAWLAERLGGARVLEPVRLARIAQAWDKQLEIERSATELAFDDSGKLALARGLGGADESALSDAAPRMSAFSRRRRFSATHVRARIAQLEAVIAEVESWLAQADGHAGQVRAMLSDNLWIEPDFAARVLDRLAQGEASMRALHAAFLATRAEFSALPLADSDDGRVPEPVSA